MASFPFSFSFDSVDWKLIALGVVLVGILSALMFYNYGTVREMFQGGASENVFTMYYADWCPHCKDAKPEFDTLVKKSPVTVGDKTCKIRMISSDENPEIMKAKGVKGFPTFKLETVDGKDVEYPGARNTDGYLAFINEHLGGGV